MPRDASVFDAVGTNGHPNVAACLARVDAARRAVPSLTGILVVRVAELGPMKGQDREVLWVASLRDGSVTRYRMADLEPLRESLLDATRLAEVLEWSRTGNSVGLDAQAVALCALHEARIHCILQTFETSSGMALALPFSHASSNYRVVQDGDVHSAISGMGEAPNGGVLWSTHGVVAWADEMEDCIDAGISVVETLEAQLRALPTGALPPPHPQAPVFRGLWSEQGPVICRRVTSDCEEALLTRADGSELALHAPVNVFRWERTQEGESARFRPLDEDGPRAGEAPFIAIVEGEGVWAVHRDAAIACAAAQLFQRYVALSATTGVIPKSRRLSKGEWAFVTSRADRPLDGRIALVTGAGSGIGLAIAHRLCDEGACVYMADLNVEKLGQELDALRSKSGDAYVSGAACDVRDVTSVQRAFDEATGTWGGLDILVNCAGLSLSRSIEDTTPEQYDLQNDVMPRGSFLCSREAARIMRLQGRGGDIVYIASKNGLFAGPNNVAYGTAKAAQIHQARLLAAELANLHVRVNVVNPDAVVRGSGIFGGGWGEDRARTYGVKLEDLGKYYASRSLLREEVLPEDIAAAVYVLVGPELRKSTGLIINVDSGFAPAMVR